MQKEGRPSNYLFQRFLNLKGRPDEKSTIFSNVQPNIRYTYTVCIHEM